MDGWTITGLGFVAGACTTFSLFPQVLKAWRSADREAISKRTYFVASAAYALWVVHGLMIGSVPITDHHPRTTEEAFGSDSGVEPELRLALDRRTAAQRKTSC